jgi:hypothetical protein
MASSPPMRLQRPVRPPLCDHRRGLRSLAEGARGLYETEQSPKGPAAAEFSRLKAAASHDWPASPSHFRNRPDKQHACQPTTAGGRSGHDFVNDEMARSLHPPIPPAARCVSDSGDVAMRKLRCTG